MNTAGLIIIGTSGTANIVQHLLHSCALLVGIIVLGLVLGTAIWSEKFLSKTMISIITRLTGLFLSAIAAKMILEGIKVYLNL